VVVADEVVGAAQQGGVDDRVVFALAGSVRGAAGVAKAHPGRPAVIATQDDLLLTDAYTLLPAHTLLWALG
jgi:hypothetical protein